ncbi:MAG: TetR/AcrR family transcriptional regulator [Nocardioidaceae bacterium]
MSPRNGGRPSGRTAMLQAAARVARRDGPGAVTVSAVVAEAGVSRGGLLYHFPGKNDLLRGLVERELGTFRSLLETGGGTTQRLRAYRDACTVTPQTEHDRVAILVALADAPDLLASWTAYVRELDRLDAEQSPGGDVSALVARLALDGLWFSDIIDPDRFTDGQRDLILHALGVGTD